MIFEFDRQNIWSHTKRLHFIWFLQIENLLIHLQCDKCNQWMPVKVVSSEVCSVMH